MKFNKEQLEWLLEALKEQGHDEIMVLKNQILSKKRDVGYWEDITNDTYLGRLY